MLELQHEQQKILRLLGRIQFGSIDLIHELTAAKRSRRSTYFLLHEIENTTRLITHKVFYIGRKQVLGSAYALTRAGAEYVAALESWDEGDVYFPQGGIGFEFPDYHHRLACARFAAHFWQWAESTEDVAVSRCSGYWKKTDGTRYPSNRVEVKGLERPIIPDWLLRFAHGEKLRLAAVEIDRTTGRTRLVERLRYYATAIDTQAISKRFNHPHAPLVLLVTETTERMAQLMADVHAGKAGTNFATDFRMNFHFSTLPDIAARGFAGAFFMLDGQPSPLFAQA